MSRPAEAMRDAMRDVGIPTGDPIIADGELHRVHVEGDRRGSRNGWYVLHPDDPPAGAFGCWKRGINETWSAANGADLSGEDLAQWREKINAQRKAREAERRKARERAREKASRMWDEAEPADPAHPYLKRKGVGAHGVRQLGDQLLVRVVGPEGELRGLQRIQPDGSKRFILGTEVTGSYFPIGGSPDQELILAEGYATASTIHEATGRPVAVAFNAGNLMPAAGALRGKIGPNVRFTVAADDDYETEGNPGITAAREAAEAVGGIVVVPQFTNGNRGTDFNDVMTAEGMDAVRHAFNGTEDSEADDLTLTDSGNSTRLVQLHGDRLHYLPKWGKWTVEDDGFWTVDEQDVRVRELAKDVGRQLKLQAASEPDEARAKQMFKFGLRSLNTHGISGMINLARGIDGIPLDHEMLDADGWLLGVENGVVDLKTGDLRKARPEDLMTRQCPVTYDPAATAPRWDLALDEWFPDPEVRAYVQRVAGAALIGRQRDHLFVIHYGGGGNGKGTAIRAIENVLVPYTVEIHLSLLVSSKHKEHDTVKADLFRARLAVASETERRVQLAEASVKNLTGADRIRARHLYQDYWSFDPTHSLWLLTNHLPRIEGRDEGVWRRIRVVKWENTFKGDEVDPDLDDKLAAEAPGILRWLVDGCLEYQNHGLDEPEKVIRDTLEYRQKEDIFARFAADTNLTFDPELQIRAGEFRDLLVAWGEAEGIDTPDAYADWLRENGASRKQRTEGGKRPWYWVGVGFDDDDHRTEQRGAL